MEVYMKKQNVVKIANTQAQVDKLAAQGFTKTKEKTASKKQEKQEA